MYLKKLADSTYTYIYTYTYTYICIYIYSPGQQPIWRDRSSATSCDISYDSHVWFQILFTLSVGGPKPPAVVDASAYSMSGGGPRGTTETSYFALDACQNGWWQKHRPRGTTLIRPRTSQGRPGTPKEFPGTSHGPPETPQEPPGTPQRRKCNNKTHFACF